MSKYQKSVDVWTLTTEQKQGLQAGQWITAGKGGMHSTKGIWCGVGKSGNDVALWLGNLSGLKGQARLERIRFMMQYAKGNTNRGNTMKRNTKDLSPQVIQVYNSLIDLSWSQPQITINHAIAATGLKRSVVALVLEELSGLGLLLVGMEDSPDGMIQTFTPIVKGGAYVHPCDDFKHDQWLLFKLENS